MLVVTDPPHGMVDHQAVADVLGLDHADASPKIRFGAPEIMRASEPARALPFAHLLSDAGLKVVVVDGHELSRVPWPAPVSSVTFTPHGLTGRFQDEDFLVRYDEAVIAVLCRPPAGYTRPQTPDLGSSSRGLQIAEAIDGMAVLDLYVERGGDLVRVTLAQGVLDPDGFGTLRRGSPADSMKAVVDECSRRFRRLWLDARLDGVRPRRRFLPGEAGFDADLRKHYSFGTLLLRHALGSISEDLKDLPHYEFGSRLACAVARKKLG